MSFTYDDNGLRTSKNVGGVTTTYIWNGSQLFAEMTDSYVIVYVYEADGSPLGMQYLDLTSTDAEWEIYWFEKNLQGDVIAVYDDSGAKHLKYTYDAWGNASLSYYSAGIYSNADLNPFRYRGYYYDTALGLYYLQSRYYDAKIGRFISADSALYDSMLGYNMFAYCYNNPVNYVDPTGCSPDWDKLFNGVMRFILGGLTVAAVALSGGSCSPLVALAYSIVATSGTVMMGIGVTETYESFTGENPIKDEIGEGLYTAYDAISTVIVGMSPAIMAYGTSVSVCFVAGTIVKAEEGDIPIENIKVGDKVYAYNSETGETALKTVVNTFVNEATELVHVFTDGNEIVCTNEHPFYSPVKGWIEACKLRAGDILINLNGEYVIVEKIQHEILESPIKVYNFEVEDFHTYFVGEGDGVLVHNRCDYVTPTGGGGYTDSIKLKNITVTFGHGGRHLLGTNLNTISVQNAIANDVVNKAIQVGNYGKEIISFSGYNIQYRYYVRALDLINIGTYFILP